MSEHSQHQQPQHQQPEVAVSFLELPFHKRFGLFLVSVAAMAGFLHAVNHTKDLTQIIAIITITILAVAIYAFGHRIEFMTTKKDRKQ